MPGLGEAARAGAVRLVAHERSQGEFATGIVFTAFGGMGVATGISLLGVGCGTGRETLCHAGLWTLFSSALVTAGAIGMILDSAPRAEVAPAYGLRLGRRTPALRLGIGPGVVAGTF